MKIPMVTNDENKSSAKWLNDEPLEHKPVDLEEERPENTMDQATKDRRNPDLEALSGLELVKELCTALNSALNTQWLELTYHCSFGRSGSRHYFAVATEIADELEFRGLGHINESLRAVSAHWRADNPIPPINPWEDEEAGNCKWDPKWDSAPFEIENCQP